MITTLSPLNYNALSSLPLGTVASYPTGMAATPVIPVTLAMPRSTVASSTGLPTFSIPTVADFAGSNPLTNQFASSLPTTLPNMNAVGGGTILPTSIPNMNTLEDGTPLYTDTALFGDINNAFPSTTNTASKALPTDATGLEGVLASMLASPRSLSALPAADEVSNSSGDIPKADMDQLLNSVDDSSNGNNNKSSVSNETLLARIDDLENMLKKHWLTNRQQVLPLLIPNSTK
jgi:hypothetical protein